MQTCYTPTPAQATLMLHASHNFHPSYPHHSGIGIVVTFEQLDTRTGVWSTIEEHHSSLQALKAAMGY